MLSAPGREINLCFKWDWNPGHFDFLSSGDRLATPILYTLFYLNLHYSTTALLHFIMVLLHFTLPWFYFTLLDSSSLYHWSTSLLFILPWLYLIVHHSIMALDHSSSLYHGFTGFYFTVCMFPEIIEMLHGIGHS